MIRPFVTGDRVAIDYSQGSRQRIPDIPDGCVARVLENEESGYVHVQFRGGKGWIWAAAMFRLIHREAK